MAAGDEYEYVYPPSVNASPYEFSWFRYRVKEVVHVADARGNTFDSEPLDVIDGKKEPASWAILEDGRIQFESESYIWTQPHKDVPVIDKATGKPFGWKPVTPTPPTVRSDTGQEK